MDSLRQEMAEDIKTLPQFHKLKITLVAGLAAVAFGIGPYSNIGKFSYLLLCWIPLVCVYLDYQYYHYLAKIFVRGTFLRNVESENENDRTHKKYEEFMDLVRSSIAPDLFGFEKKVLVGQVSCYHCLQCSGFQFYIQRNYCIHRMN